MVVGCSGYTHNYYATASLTGPAGVTATGGGTVGKRLGKRLRHRDGHIHSSNKHCGRRRILRIQQRNRRLFVLRRVP